MRIRVAQNCDCPGLPAIEQSAGLRFADVGMHDVAGDANVPAEAWEPHCASETVWVAVDEDDQPYGFLGAGRMDDFLFIYELAVEYDRQRQGVGRALLAAAETKARSMGLRAVYLTTFRDVSFNGPYYLKLGYEPVDEAGLPDALKPVLDAERRRFAEPDRARWAMRKAL